MLTNTIKNFNSKVERYARKNIIKKLQKQGIDYHNLAEKDFDDLVSSEISVLKRGMKKVVIGVGMSLLFGTVTGI